MELRVLIVDDSLIIRKNLTKFLTTLGHSIAGEAKTGVEAVSECKHLNPDLITMDITMPEMDGITAVKEIRKTNKDVKIIMSTSHGQEQMVLDAIKAGARGYILKPITQDKLEDAIQKVFAEKKPKPGSIEDEIMNLSEEDLLGDDLLDDDIDFNFK